MCLLKQIYELYEFFNVNTESSLDKKELEDVTGYRHFLYKYTVVNTAKNINMTKPSKNIFKTISIWKKNKSVSNKLLVKKQRLHDTKRLAMHETYMRVSQSNLFAWTWRRRHRMFHTFAQQEAWAENTQKNITEIWNGTKSTFQLTQCLIPAFFDDSESRFFLLLLAFCLYIIYRLFLKRMCVIVWVPNSA